MLITTGFQILPISLLDALGALTWDAYTHTGFGACGATALTLSVADCVHVSGLQTEDAR